MSCRPDGFSHGTGARWPIIIFLFIFLPLGGVASGQDTAGIIGQVTDESGGVLPGVTVTATGPSLQVPEVNSVTNERGEYRLTPLPIGTYQVVYALSGFQSLRREGLRLTVGFVAKVDVVMKVGALEESVTVSGAAPVVDATSTTASTQLTREVLELVPTGRVGFAGVLAQAPGVRGTFDIGGSSGGSPTYRAFGNSNDPWPTLEGVLTMSPKATDSGNYFDFASVEEAQVLAVGNGVEQPSKGLLLSVIVKSGGNDFHGSEWWQQNSRSLQSHNIDDALRAQGVTNGGGLEERYMVNGDLGGRLIRDKLWFYAGTTANRNKTTVLGATPQPDGSPAVQDQLYGYINQKYSYQMSKSNRFVGFQQWGEKRITREVTQFRPWEARSYQFLHGQTIKGEWQSVPTNSLVISVQSGIWQWHSPFYGFSPNVATFDTATQYESGMNTTFAGEDPLERNYHSKGNLTWFKPNVFLGNHEFKVGGDFVASLISRAHISRDSPGMWLSPPSPLPVIGDDRLIYKSGVPFEVQTYNFPVKPTSLAHYFGTYVQDNWSIARRLTLNLGLRYAHDHAYIPAQCRAAGEFVPAQCFAEVDNFKVWNTLAPRLHAAFDVTGSGKTVIKGGWGRFDHRRLIDPEIIQSNQNLQIFYTWLWHDNNHDGLYQPGEVNLDPNGPDYVSIAGQGNGSYSVAVANPNELEPKEDEYMVSLERELLPNWGVRLSGVYTKSFNNYAIQNNFRPYGAYNIPVTNPIPAPNGVVPADNLYGTIMYYDYPATLRGLAFEQGMLINDPNNDQTNKGIEFALNKRLVGGWQFQTSYSYTAKHIPIAGPLPAYNPNSIIYASDNTPEWLADFSGAYMFPHGVMVSANYETRSGSFFARQVLFSGGKQIPTQVLNVEPLTANQLPTLTHLDLRFEKRFSLARGQRAAVRLNVFNALNVNTVTGVNVRSGGSFMKPSGIVAPRILEASASYNF